MKKKNLPKARNSYSGTICTSWDLNGENSGLNNLNLNTTSDFNFSHYDYYYPYHTFPYYIYPYDWTYYLCEENKSYTPIIYRGKLVCLYRILNGEIEYLDFTEEKESISPKITTDLKEIFDLVRK